MKTLAFGLVLLASLSEGTIFVKDGFVGVGVDLSKLGIGGKCPPSVNVTCTCGRGQPHILVTIPVCSYSYRWKIRCKPCDDLKESEACLRYQGCQQCHANGGDECASCPLNKFGKWCENDCLCVNGGSCERNGKCTCPDGYEGQYCQSKKGCAPPGPITIPVQVTLTPPDRPVTAIYSCPDDHELRGTSVSTCLPTKRWSSDPPICLPVCPLLSAPANGRLKFSSNELVEGAKAQISCNAHHRLIGESILTCLAGGHWDEELPICERLATCPDPGDVKYSERTVSLESQRVGGHFIQDSKIHYRCSAGYEQLGVDTILCLYDGTWSSELPSCIKVSNVVPDCFTKGSQIISDIGVSVRILCPPECADEDFNVWGTSIYRQDSSVCQAAIHSAKITNSGGLVNVIRNGEYSHFTGGVSNNIESESFAGQDDSFRFDKLAPQHRSGNVEDCDKGLVILDRICAYLSNNIRLKHEAEAVCYNMGLELKLPELDSDRVRLVTILSSKNIDFIWAQEEPNSTIGSNDLCSGAEVDHLKFNITTRYCRDPQHFVCLKKSESSNLAVCEDPGPLEDGSSTPVGQIDGIFYVGSSISFACRPPVHHLRGAEVISCTANGTWSAKKPTCIKVNACEDPPVPIGGFVTYLPPLKTAQRVAVHNVARMRMARLPLGAAALPRSGIQPTTTAEPETISLPPGFHRLGARAMYDCESRYYKLIGSRTRRCQGQGEWSGRPPTCIPVCGRSDSPRSPFIVNGNATDIGQWPWQAGIARNIPEEDLWFIICGASLLNERWIITAAHCITYAGTTLVIEPDKFQVYLGKYHRQDSKDDEYVQVRKIQEIHIHPDYDPGLFDADIALIQLDSPVQLNSRVQPVCLPTEQTTRENLADGKKGVVTGWGMDENQTYSETLQQAVLPVISRAACEKGYQDSDLPLTVTENMYCAGFAKGRTDACLGDSGGPMVFTDDSSVERKWVLEGIVSWGSPQGCGNPNQYGGFTTVSRFLDWIHLFF